MTDEREEVIAELTKEVNEIHNVAIIRFILWTVQAFKRKAGAAI